MVFSEGMRALVVEDEPEMAALLARELTNAGFAVDRAIAVEEASALLRLATYTLVILDRRLPDGDGLTLLPEITGTQSQAGTIVLSALGAVPDLVSGLDAGADDYLAKPFDIDELRARIRAAIRRNRPTAQQPPIKCGQLEYRAAAREFTVRGELLVLRRREMALLELLISRARRVVRRDVLVGQVYALDDEPSDNTLDAHVSRLRRRLETVDAGVSIRPVRGIGYIMDDR
ncbi:DNA-binding response regulator [Niveispirillum cyanobacteriorum]|nr:DNA-binding response regulator [Niveispirillum cyanobacteriorum]